MVVLECMLLCLIWGTTWIGIKISLGGLPPFLNAFLRFFIALLALFVFLKFKKIPFRITRREVTILAVSGFFMYIFDYGMIYWGARYLQAGVTAVFFSTFTFFTAIWARVLFRDEKFRLSVFLGLLLGLSGLAVVFYDQFILTQFNNQIVIASVTVIVGAAGGALAVVIVKKYLPEMNPYRLTFYQMGAGVIFLGLLSLFFDDFSDIRIDGRITGAVLYLGLVGSALAFAIYYKLLQQMSAVNLALIIYITPVVALIGGCIFLGETVTLRSLIGVAVIFSGIGLTQKKNNNKLRCGPIG